MIVHRTDLSVRKAQACRYETDRMRYPVARRYSETRSMRFRFWAHGLWQGRAFHRCRLMHFLNSVPTRAIRYVFGSFAEQAIRVARCESNFRTGARNGQYENIFQMGVNERRTYGWHVAGSSALDASYAARSYFIASGRDWSPWSCKP